MHAIKIKRVYEKPAENDGYRMLIDRLWPRGLKKELAYIDEWNKTIAPSTKLRKWFGHDPEKFEQFTKLYKAELKQYTNVLRNLKTLTKIQPLTLLYAAKDKEHNHAIVLLSVLQNSVK